MTDLNSDVTSETENVAEVGNAGELNEELSSDDVFSESNDNFSVASDEYLYTETEDEDEENSHIKDIGWTDVEIEPEHFNFSGQEIVDIDVNLKFTPIAFFKLLFDSKLSSEIIKNINELAKSRLDSQEFAQYPILKEWRNVKKREFRKFLGLSLFMSYIRMPSLRCYWEKDPLFSCPIFRKTFRPKRYKAILSCLSFECVEENCSPLQRINDLLEHVFENLKKVYTPPKKLVLQNSTNVWRGQLTSLKIRRHSAVRFHKLCSTTGYVLDLKVDYRGHLFDDEDKKKYAFDVTTALLKDYLNKGHIVYTDPLYSSVQLAEYLLSNRTHLNGTLNKYRLPKCIKKKRLQKWETIWKTRNNIVVQKWKGYLGTELMISTNQKPLITKAQTKSRKSYPVPIILDDICKSAACNNIDEVMEEIYPLARKRFSWDLKAFFHILDMTVWNSHLLYNHIATKRISYDVFRKKLYFQLMGIEKSDE